MFLETSHCILGSLSNSKVIFLCDLLTPFSPKYEDGKLQLPEAEKGPQSTPKCRGNTYWFGNFMFLELVLGTQLCSAYKNTLICT